MARRLLNAGYTVNIYDKHTSPVLDQLERLGARRFESAKKAAAASEVLFTALPTVEAVEEALCGDVGGFAGITPGTIWADLSTSDRNVTARLSAECQAARGIALECPISNLSHMGLDRANAAAFVGGDEAHYQTIKPIIEHFAATSFHTGQIGTAQAVKLLTNLSFHTAAAAAGEALVACVASGIPVEHALKSLAQGPGGSTALEQFVLFALDGSYDNSCALSVAVKDLMLTASLNDELSLTNPSLRAEHVLDPLLERSTPEPPCHTTTH